MMTVKHLQLKLMNHISWGNYYLFEKLMVYLIILSYYNFLTAAEISGVV